MNLSANAIGVTRGGTTLLRGVTVACLPGTVTAILGPNGAGKSTLLSCLSGIDRPTSGRVTLGDTALSELTMRDRAKIIGLLPQGGELNWDISTRQLIALGQMPHQGNFGLSNEGAAKVEAAMIATDTQQFAHRNILSLSGGERARVMLARVLAGTPRWLLADEPLANLDPGHQLDMLALLRAQAVTGVGVVVVLHDLNHAAAIADHIILLNNGAVAEQGNSKSVLTPANLARVFNINVALAPSISGQTFLNITGRNAQTPLVDGSEHIRD